MIKLTRKNGLIILFTLILIFTSSQAFAIENSVLATGTQKLLDDLAKWLPVIAIAAGSVVSIYFFIRKGAADEMDKKKWSDRISTAITSTIGATIVASVISVIIGYYK